MKGKRSITLALIAALAVSLAMVAGFAHGGNAANSATVKVALVSDIGKFNDKSFNQSQLEGLMRAKAKLGVSTLPLQSNSRQ